MKNSFTQQIAFVSLVFFGFILSGCGGGSGGASQTAITNQTSDISLGRLFDSPVIGIQYVSGNISGYTDKYGFYKYQVGQNTTFTVGGIVLGVVSPTGFVTPIHLVSGAKDETNPQVVNILRFLQSIDDDADTGNGINITTAMHSAASNLSINFNQSVVNFESDPAVQNAIAVITATSNAGSRVLLSQNTAVTHFKTSIYSSIRGTYCGTYSGSDSGNWKIDVDSAGVITGSGNSSVVGAFTITGNVKTNGAAVFQQVISGSASGAGFSGTFDFINGLSGSWTESANNWSGTFAGTLSYSNCTTTPVTTTGSLVSANRITYDVYNDFVFYDFRTNGAPPDLFRPYSAVVTASDNILRKDETGMAWVPQGIAIPIVFGRSPFNNVYVYKNNVLDWFDVASNILSRNIGVIPVSMERYITFFAQDIPVSGNQITLLDGAMKGVYAGKMSIAGYSCDLYSLSPNVSNVQSMPGNEVCIADFGGSLKRFLYVKMLGSFQLGNSAPMQMDIVVRARKVEPSISVDSGVFQVP